MADTPDEIKRNARPQVWSASNYAIELEWERVNVMRSLTTLDVGDELCDEDVVAAIKAGDPNAVGRVVMAKINAWADRVAQRLVDAS